MGGRQFTSTILQRNCHEFISYESLLDLLPRTRRSAGPRGARPQVTPRSALPLTQALALLDRALSALDIRGVQAQLGLIKSTMLQLDPAFAERDYGVTSFSGLMEKLEEQGHISVNTVDSHLVVERVKAAAEAKAAEPRVPEREDALPILQEVLADNVHLLEMGIPEKEVEALMRAAEPDFSESELGFHEFGELVNLACDKGLLREEADAKEILRYYPGPDLHEPLRPGKADEKEAAAVESKAGDEKGEAGEGADADLRRRRRRRRRGGRGRSGEGERERERTGPIEVGPKRSERTPSDEPSRPAADGAREGRPSVTLKSAEATAAEARPSEGGAKSSADEPARAAKKAAKKKAAPKKAAKKKAAKKKKAAAKADGQE